MPWKVMKRDCKQADGSSGSYIVLKEKGDGSTEQSSCHDTKEKAQGSVAARKMGEGRTLKITKRQLKRLIREAIISEGTQDPPGLEKLLAGLNVSGGSYSSVADTLSTAFYEFEEDAEGMKEEVEINSGGLQDASGQAINWPIESYKEIYALYRASEKGYKDPYQRGVQ